MSEKLTGQEDGERDHEMPGKLEPPGKMGSKHGATEVRFFYQIEEGE